MSNFREDHYCESLRGLKKPSPSNILKALAKRCQWLEKKIETNTVLGKPISFHLEELAAIVAIVEKKMPDRDGDLQEELIAERARKAAQP